jgi:hypothetical protein
MAKQTFKLRIKKAKKPSSLFRSMFITNQTISDHQQREISLACLLYFDKLLQKNANESDLDNILTAINVGTLLAEKGLGVSYLDDLHAAKNVLASKKENIATESFIATEQEVSVLRHAINIHLEQIACATTGEFADAIMQSSKYLHMTT